MKRTKKKDKSNLAKQMIRRAEDAKGTQPKSVKKYDGNLKTVINTGSTLLDLAISGGRIRGGGIPAGILVEIFGPSGAGKTVMLCEIAGDIQRKEGNILFHDPEARLNKQFAQMFDLKTEDIDYSTPDTVTEVFQAVRSWEPESPSVNGIFTDSLAALSTNLEMEKDEGDKMGMRRAKEFSEELRKTCRILAKNNQLMVCSNQVRVNADAGPYGQKYRTPDGEAVGFYASLRLRVSSPKKIKLEQSIKGKKQTRVIGTEVEVEVYKSSVWKPYHTAPLVIIFDYGIDDVRANLQYLKSNTKATTYVLGGENIGRSIDSAIQHVEKHNLEDKLKDEVIDLWEMIESKFNSERKSKKR